MALDQKEQYRALIKKYNINFDGPVEQDAWPADHRKTFNDLRRLGRMEFKKYQESIRADSDIHPWREQTKRRAERIKGLATLCREERMNEAGWRHLLESEILVRFTIEIACRMCRARLWRSELEASLDNSSQFAESLKERRKRRAPCSCNTMQRSDDPHEQEEGFLFATRVEEAIVHDEDANTDLPKKEIPDRIYGLRRTRRFERLLARLEDKRPSPDGKAIGQSVKSSPFGIDGKPVIFPFLALEAKSEKGRDSFSDIEVQTAFTIRTLLNLQRGLGDAAGESCESQLNPLVWFFSCKGEQWRVSAAFIKHGRGVQSYHVVDLWDGRIVSKEGALQLLLIVDYIFDWARDVYRETIISHLRSLRPIDAHSLANDTDILSKNDASTQSMFWAPDTELNTHGKGKEREGEAQPIVEDIFRYFDSPYGAIRDARYLRSRFISLYITEENISELFQSMSTTKKAQSAARSILQCLTDGWRVTAEGIDRLELMWTGVDRENPSLFSPAKPFLVCVNLTAYISPSWEQTRHMSCLAVSADAIDTLLSYANQKADDDWSPSQFPFFGAEAFVGFFQDYRQICVQENLLAAVSRACLTTKIVPPETKRKKGPEYSGSSVVPALSIEEVDAGTLYRFDPAFVPDSQPTAHDFISTIYNTHKIGRKEPSLSIIRSSTRVEEQSLEKETIPTRWPTTPCDDIMRQKAIAVTSKNPSSVSGYIEFCLFVIDRSELEGLAHLSLNPDSVGTSMLQTRRLDPKPGSGWGRRWNRTDVRSRDKSRRQTLKGLLDHLKNLTDFCDPSSSETEDGPDAEALWKPKKGDGERHIFPYDNPVFGNIMDFGNTLRSNGQQVTSIMAPKRAAGSGTLAPQRRAENLIPDGEPGPSNSARGRDGNHNVGEWLAQEPGRDKRIPPTPGPSKRARERVSVDGRHGRSRDVGEQTGEPSSSRASHKRRRTTNGDQFIGDFLTDEELGQLLSEGRFE